MQLDMGHLERVIAAICRSMASMFFMPNKDPYLTHNPTCGCGQDIVCLFS